MFSLIRTEKTIEMCNKNSFIFHFYKRARVRACVRACVCVFACVHMFLCKQTDYFMAVILFTGEESNSTVYKSSARVPTTSSPTSVWMAMRSVLVLALTNLTVSHLLPYNFCLLCLFVENPRRKTTVHPGERPSFFETVFFSNPFLHNSIERSHDQGPHQF